MRILKQWLPISITILAVFILSGCLYPDERRVENQIPNQAQLEMVQRQVDIYRDRTGLLPILTRDANISIYERYIIDFRKLIEMRLIERAPGNAFEQGGVYQYVLVDVETNPTVKIIDLRLSRQIADYQRRLNVYMRSNYLPVARFVDNGFFIVDHSKLNLKQPMQVKSPYSQNYLPVIADMEGRLAIDYRIELYQHLQNVDDLTEWQDRDLRGILLQQSPFVPVASFPYTILDSEPALIRPW
jgi:hypothetical protein